MHSATDGSSLSLIVAGFTSTIEYILLVDNTKDDAFQTRLAFVLPTKLVQLNNIFNKTNSGEVHVQYNYMLGLHRLTFLVSRHYREYTRQVV